MCLIINVPEKIHALYDSYKPVDLKKFKSKMAAKLN